MYIYPTNQHLIQNSLFLMYSDIQSGKYDWYKIPYYNRGVELAGYISHQSILEKLGTQQLEVTAKTSLANGKLFIKIPLKYISHDQRIMEQTKSIPNKLF